MSEQQPSYHPWRTYVIAREEARRRGDRRVGTEHLAVALLDEPAVAEAVGSDPATARRTLQELDREALGQIGVELPDVPEEPVGDYEIPARPTMREVLHRRLPMTPAAKEVLRDSGREMRRPGRHHPGPGRVMQELLERPSSDPAIELLRAMEIDIDVARGRLGRSR